MLMLNCRLHTQTPFSSIVSLCIVLLTGWTLPCAVAERPNIILIVSDDQGFADVSFRGSEIETPNIDRIAREGAVLDRFYVCPICSPTRAGLMTGRYPIRFGMMRSVVPPWREGGLPHDELTLPEALEGAGYTHRGAFGKWHLGHSDVQYHPLRRGFTEFYGHYNGNIDYFTHNREGELDWHDGYRTSRDVGYSTDLIATRATQFIRDHANNGPFFCYVPFNAPHSPFQAPEVWLDHYKELDGSSQRRTYAAMVSAMDHGIGTILDALDELEIAEETLVWFSSDNGGTGKAGSNIPLRGTKSEVFEGGIRVVAAARWPGTIPAGSTVTAPLAYIDVMPTLLGLAGLDNQQGKPFDGLNIIKQINGEHPDLDRDLLVYCGQSGKNERMAILTSTWKLIVIGPDLSGLSKPGPEHQLFLFAIDRDPLEQHNLSTMRPKVVSRLFDRLVAFRELQPADGLPHFSIGREGFQAPKDWVIPGTPPQ